MSEPLLDLRDLEATPRHGAHSARVLHGVSLAVAVRTTVGVVSESGSGKSTLAKTIVGIHRAQAGIVRFRGHDIDVRRGGRRDALRRRRIQMIPQNPYSSLDPQRTIGQTLAEAVDPAGTSVRRHLQRIAELLEQVSLDEAAMERYFREFSGVQRQRVAIARALAVRPDLVIADEITSALDLSTQAEVLRLPLPAAQRLGLTMVFVSHNLAVVQQVSSEVVGILYRNIAQAGPTSRVI